MVMEFGGNLTNIKNTQEIGQKSISFCQQGNHAKRFCNQQTARECKEARQTKVLSWQGS